MGERQNGSGNAMEGYLESSGRVIGEQYKIAHQEAFFCLYLRGIRRLCHPLFHRSQQDVQTKGILCYCGENFRRAMGELWKDVFVGCFCHYLKGMSISFTRFTGEKWNCNGRVFEK